LVGGDTFGLLNRGNRVLVEGLLSFFPSDLSPVLPRFRGGAALQLADAVSENQEREPEKFSRVRFYQLRHSAYLNYNPLRHTGMTR
jgi:hypothetical protein